MRGKTYTFVVEGGQNPNSPAAYHPFYITDDPEGGYQFKTPEQKKAVSCLTFYGPKLDTSLSDRPLNLRFEPDLAFFLQVKVFGGVKTSRLGSEPTGLGRLCEWKEDPNEAGQDHKSFGSFQRSLSLDCQEGQPGIMQWTPDKSTPDLVYYQCYTHRYHFIENNFEEAINPLFKRWGNVNLFLPGSTVTPKERNRWGR